MCMFVTEFSTFQHLFLILYNINLLFLTQLGYHGAYQGEGAPMTYPRRVQSESELYHVVARGVGRQIIFEDDDDRIWFLDKLAYECRAHLATLIAYCLMDNHAHLLLQVPGRDISPFMQELLGKYARHYNDRHDRVGHLFQGRFRSDPIETEEYLLQAVRYIHQNPEKAGMAATKAYRWSSYHEYVGRQEYVDVRLVMSMFDSVGSFERFHDMEGIALAEPDDSRAEKVAKTALAIGVGEFGDGGLSRIKGLPRAERDAALRRLLSLGLSVRQVERITGVGRGIVSRVGACDR